MTNALATTKVQILGAPLDLGAGRRGVDMGPSALRVARIGALIRELGYKVEGRGDVRVHIAEEQSAGDPKMRFKKPIQETVEELAARVEDALAAGALPLVLGGDHSVSIGSAAGIARHL